MTLTVLLLALAPAAHAEDPAVAPAATTPSVSEPLLDAIELPNAAEALRQDGVAPDEVKEALRAAAEKKMSAAEAAQTMRDTHDAVRRHGVPPGMGPFVRAQIEAGVRGKDLAEAIRKECEARGIPPRPPPGAGHPPPPGGGPNDGRGHGDGPPGAHPGGHPGDGKGPPPPPPGGKEGKDGKAPPPKAH